MAKWITLIGAACTLIACGTSATPDPKSPSAERTDEESRLSESQETAHGEKRKSETSGWSVAPPSETRSGPGIGNRKAQVVVTSNPKKHGDALHFHFFVNSIPISGVFSAPGGESSTFTIPVGTVQFTVDECEGDTQGFPLEADASVPISCELTTDGDCCEVAYPVEEKPKK
jgi:hypothetical protein